MDTYTFLQTFQKSSSLDYCNLVHVELQSARLQNETLTNCSSCSRCAPTDVQDPRDLAKGDPGRPFYTRAISPTNMDKKMPTNRFELCYHASQSRCTEYTPCTPQALLARPSSTCPPET